jgi:hypothetical protein
MPNHPRQQHLRQQKPSNRARILGAHLNTAPGAWTFLSAAIPDFQARTLALLFCALAISVSLNKAHAQLATPGVFLSRSVSGEFIIQSAPASFGSPLVSFIENDTNFVRLDPTLLTISCERIKQILWRELDAKATWSGKIFLRLYAVGSADDPVTIDSAQFRDGWQYCVTLPTLIQRERYVRAMVKVLLLEMANRNARLHIAEIPPWLSEGLSRQLLASDAREVILPPPQMSDAGLRMTALLVNARKDNPLEQAHKELSANTPLNFQQLSWPVPDELTGEPGELYRSCAQFFVHQLLATPDGPASMRSLLEDLPQYYNWQFAFLHAFRDTFTRPLDIEKWWSLQLVHFTGRELSETWPVEESWQKLDDLLRSTVQIRIGTNELPLHAEVTLQTIIGEWDPTRQTPALESKLRELQMLRPRLAHDLGPLVDDYCRTIETYVQNMNHKGFVLPFRKHALFRRNAGEALQHLDELDTRRASLRPPDKENPPIQANSSPASSP